MNNIDNLTFGELKRIAAMFQASTAQQPAPHPFIGKYVICRCYSAGVHAGELVSKNGEEVVLKNSRRLWRWTANGGVALSGLAMLGLKSGKIDTALPEQCLNGVIETIPCSEAAEASINESK